VQTTAMHEHLPKNWPLSQTDQKTRRKVRLMRVASAFARFGTE